MALEQDVEVILSLDVDEIFEQFDTRYDVYSNGTRIGLTIFLHEDIVYFADTSYEGTNNALIIWSIYEVKQEDRFYPNCEQATTQLTLSGVYYTTTTYYCVTEDYDFYYQTTLFLDGPEVVSEQITLLYDETMTYFTNVVRESKTISVMERGTKTQHRMLIQETSLILKQSTYPGLNRLMKKLLTIRYHQFMTWYQEKKIERIYILISMRLIVQMDLVTARPFLIPQIYTSN